MTDDLTIAEFKAGTFRMACPVCRGITELSHLIYDDVRMSGLFTRLHRTPAGEWCWFFNLDPFAFVSLIR